MSTDQILSWVVSAIGILGFYLAGKKIWWAWYVNIANQVFWTMFAFITQNWGFLLATAFYLWVFGRNAYLWTKNRNKKPEVEIPAVGFGDAYLWTKNRNKKPEVEIPAVGFGDAIRIKQTNKIVFLDIYEERYQQGVFVTFQSHEGDQPTRPIVVSGSDDPTDK